MKMGRFILSDRPLSFTPIIRPGFLFVMNRKRYMKIANRKRNQRLQSCVTRLPSAGSIHNHLSGCRGRVGEGQEAKTGHVNCSRSQK